MRHAPAAGEPARRSLRPLVIAAAGFVAFFAALFAQFPLAGRLPGNADTWFAIALSNTYAGRLAGAAGGEPPATALYPGGNPIQFGESSPGVALLFVAIRSLGLDDVNAYYALLCLLFAATALAVFALARHGTGSAPAAVFAALAFTCSNFTLANIDDCVIVFFGIAALAAGLLVRFLDRPERLRLLYAAAALGGLQVYFSAYVFLFLAVWLGILLLEAAPSLRERAARSPGTAPALGRHLLAAGALYCALGAPFFAFYAGAMRAQEFVTARSFDLLVTSVGSLDPGDLLRALPGNLVHPPGAPHLEEDSARLARWLYEPATLQAAVEDPDFQTLVRPYAPPGDEAFWISTRRRAHVGFLLYGLALFALRRPCRSTRALVVLFCAGLVIALGPVITLAGTTIPTPLYPINRWIEFTNLFRVPSRAFFLSLMALCLLAARTVAHWSGRLAARRPGLARALPFLLGALFLAENLPVPMMSFEGRRYAEPAPALRGFFAGRDAPAVLLHLPSRTGFSYAGAAADLYPLNREIIYMNWQTYLRQDTMNGVNGYLPRSRVAVQRFVDRLPDDDALDGLLALAGDDRPLYVAFHPGLALPGEEGMLARLEQAPRLRSVLRDDRAVLFEVGR